MRNNYHQIMTDQETEILSTLDESQRPVGDLQRRLDELWEMQKLILKRLSGIR